ncbi:MAG: hypothetical protein J3K34DRAFT_415834 [Monoraphidium minutum]|nr:MAG: hypothetical protein J3K34DRAFT_415834 [Monoraphidium minutum]
METPAAVPNSDAKMYWLVFLAVMSAMLLSRTNERLNTLRVLPLAIQLRPLIMLAQLPSTRNALGTRMVAISMPVAVLSRTNDRKNQLLE